MDLGKIHTCTPYCDVVIPGMHVAVFYSVKGSTKEAMIENVSHMCKRVIDLREEPDIRLIGPLYDYNNQRSVTNVGPATHDKAWLLMFEPYDT